MPTGTIILLGAFAGLTIYLGLPFAFFKGVPQAFKNFFTMLATGILIFLLYDVVSKASDPINELIDQVRKGHATSGILLLDIFLFTFALLLGLIGLVYVNKYFIGRIYARKRQTSEDNMSTASPQRVLVGVDANTLATAEATGVVPPVSTVKSSSALAALPGTISPKTLALFIAVGIGFHNFSEGLAIGQSAAFGALPLAVVLIIGFGLHNMTEGFGIAGPLTGQTISWRFIALLGLIGGGPTFLGTLVGITFQSPQVFIFCLALAAGAIIYVVAELLGIAKRFKSPEIVMWGLLVGFLLGYMTDLLVTYAGA